MPRPTPPTVAQLRELLRHTRVRVVDRARVDGMDVLGYYDGEVVVVGRAGHSGGAREVIQTAIHELIHAYLHLRCQDHRDRHDRVYRWELALYESRALRAEVAARLLDAWLFGAEDP